MALRPPLIIGPGDPHLIPRVIERARAGKLVQVGDGTNLVDVTYVVNAADAHLLAADALGPDAPCAGRAYFISQGAPVSLWPWLNEILAAVGAPAVRRRISYATARRAGWALEVVYRPLPPPGEPLMNRCMDTHFDKSLYFSI